VANRVNLLLGKKFNRIKHADVNAVVITTTTMNIASFSWDTVNWVSQLLLVVFAGLALVSGTIVNRRQSKQLIELSTKPEEKREKTALAEKTTLELGRLIKEPRTIDRKKADEILDWGEKGTVSIFFSMIGDEPVNLARQLATILDAHGWQIKEVTSALVPSEKGIVIRLYGDTKEIVVATHWAGAPEPAKTLHRLLVEAVAGNPMVETRVSSDRAKDKVEVTIAGKY